MKSNLRVKLILSIFFGIVFIASLINNLNPSFNTDNLIIDSRDKRQSHSETLKNSKTGVIYSEDFNDGIADYWVSIGGTWTVENNQYKATGSSGERVRSYYNNQTFSNYIYEGDFKLGSGNEMQLIFNIQDISTGVDQGHYCQITLFYNDPYGREDTAVLYSNQNGQMQHAEISYDFNHNQWYHFKIISLGSFMEFSLNDSLILSYSNLLYSSGYIGMKSMYGPTAYWDNIKVSQIYTSSKIHIVNNTGWSNAKDAGICIGNGTYSNPYIIKDLVINAEGSGSCISIENSTAHFIIENCSLYNSEYYWGGIHLSNVSNAYLVNLTCLSNGRGIYLYSSENNTISGSDLHRNTYGINLFDSHGNTIVENTINNNTDHGLYLSNSDSNDIARNNINYNSYNGVNFYDSENNIVIENVINGNLNHGIEFYYGKNNNISRNIISNNQNYGMYLYNSDFNVIKGNVINNNQNYGLYLSSCDSVNITENTINNNQYYGISLYYGVDNQISGNIIEDNQDFSIYLYYSTGCSIFGNNMTNSFLNINGNLADLTSHNISSNLVNGKPLYYYVNERNLGPNNFSNAGDVWLINCSNSLISNLIISNLGHITLSYCDDVIINNNTVGNNQFGIYLYQNSDINISENTVNDNEYGIYVASYSYVIGSITLTENNVYDNYYGIFLSSCRGVTISSNTVDNNFYGIRVYFGSNNLIELNEIKNNDYGIYLYYSESNTLSNNDFTNNGVDVQRIRDEPYNPLPQIGIVVAVVVVIIVIICLCAAGSRSLKRQTPSPYSIPYKTRPTPVVRSMEKPNTNTKSNTNIKLSLEEGDKFIYASLRGTKLIRILIENQNSYPLIDVRVELSGPPQVNILNDSSYVGLIGIKSRRNVSFTIIPKVIGNYFLRATLKANGGHSATFPIELQVSPEGTSAIPHITKEESPEWKEKISITTPYAAPDTVTLKSPECPSCGVINPIDAKFCYNCGINLKEKSEEERKPEEERVQDSKFYLSLEGDDIIFYTQLNKSKVISLIIQNKNNYYIKDVRVELSGPPQVSIIDPSKHVGLVGIMSRRGVRFIIVPKELGTYNLTATLTSSSGHSSSLPIVLRAGTAEKAVVKYEKPDVIIPSPEITRKEIVKEEKIVETSIQQDPKLKLYLDGDELVVQSFPNKNNEISMIIQNQNSYPIKNVKVELSGPPQVSIINASIYIGLVGIKSRRGVRFIITPKELGAFNLKASLTSSSGHNFSVPIEVRVETAKETGVVYDKPKEVTQSPAVEVQKIPEVEMEKIEEKEEMEIIREEEEIEEIEQEEIYTRDFSIETSLFKTIEGHDKGVSSVAISPNGEFIISGSHDKSIKIWELATGKLVRTLEGHEKYVTSIVLSPDGKHVISGSNDKTVKIWEFSSGKLLRTLEGHTWYVLAATISPDGDYVVSSSFDKKINVWNFKTGELLKTLEGHRKEVSSVVVSPDNKFIVSGSYDRSIIIWDLESGEIVRTIKGHKKSVTSVAISPEGEHIISSSDDKNVAIWEFSTGKLIKLLKGHTWYVLDVTVPSDTKLIFSSSFDKSINIWDYTGGELLETLKGHKKEVSSVAVSPDGKYLISGSNDKTIKIWKISQLPLILE
ncbi:MAG: NosD domain-containing protein [Promethearchaeota archaeon]